MYQPYPPPQPFGPPGYGPPYVPPSPLGTVRTGALLVGGTLAAFVGLFALQELVGLVHVGYSIFSMLFWVRMCGYVVLMVGLVMMSRLPRAFGAQMCAWSSFAFFTMGILFILARRLSHDLVSQDVADWVSWFIFTGAYTCLAPLMMLTASQTGIRWGAATNAVVGSLVGIWRVGVAISILMTPDEGPTYRPHSPTFGHFETLLMLPALAAIAGLGYELREIKDPLAYGPLGPPMAPMPGGYPPPPGAPGGYGPPGPPAHGGYGPPPAPPAPPY